MPHRARDWAVRIGKWGVVVGALAWLITTDRLQFRDFDLREGGWTRLAGALFLILASMSTTVLRWRMLLVRVGTGIPFGQTFRLGAVGIFFNTFLFGGLGGDAVKVGYILRMPGERASGTASIVVDRVVGLLGLFLLGGGALTIAWAELPTPQLRVFGVVLFGVLTTAGLTAVVAFLALVRGRLAGLLAVLGLLIALGAWRLAAPPPAGPGGTAGLVCALAGILAAAGAATLVPGLQPGRGLHRRIAGAHPLGARAMQLVEAFLAYRNHPATLLAAVVVSAGVHAGTLTALYLVSTAMGNPATAGQVFFAAPIALVANVLPVPMGGLGVGEACYDRLLALVRTPGGEAVTGGAAVFMSFRALLALAQVALGLPFYLRGGGEAPDPATPPAARPAEP